MQFFLTRYPQKMLKLKKTRGEYKKTKILEIQAYTFFQTTYFKHVYNSY